MSRTCKISAILVVVALLAGPALAADRHVPSSFRTIASALAASQPGDRVVIAPGTYREHGLQLRSGVTLIGSPASPSSVVIDAGGNGRVMGAVDLDVAVNVRGVTITGGVASGPNAFEESGGGLRINRASVHLEDVVVIGNMAEGSGGGVRVTEGALTMKRCVVRDNVAARGGGGLEACYEATCDVAETIFLDNEAAWGGGAAVRYNSTATLTDSRFLYNRALTAPGLGGALASDLDAALNLAHCLVADNEARYGGGIYTATDAGPQLVSVTVDRNTSQVAGGGLYGKASSALVIRSIISFNSHAAFVSTLGAAPVLVGSDIYGHPGGNWIGNLASQLGVNDNFSADPRYCAPDDRGLQSDSPCLAAVNGFGLVGAYGEGCQVLDAAPELTVVATLSAQPNPFNPLTHIVFTLPDAGRARVGVFDLAGRSVGVLLDEDRPAGEHRLRWDARDAAGRTLASGVYLLVLETGGTRVTSKLMLAR